MQNQRVQGDDLAMAVENVDGQLARDEARDRRYYGENLLFSQHVTLFEIRCDIEIFQKRDEQNATNPCDIWFPDKRLLVGGLPILRIPTTKVYLVSEDRGPLGWCEAQRAA